jgi:putative addiction module component (TIGR02574 family)
MADLLWRATFAEAKGDTVAVSIMGRAVVHVNTLYPGRAQMDGAGVIPSRKPRKNNYNNVHGVSLHCIPFTWDSRPMNTESQHILRTALALPESDRAEIAASLIQSLDRETDEHADAAWAAEIRRRLDSIDSGEVRLVPWDDVMHEMHGRSHGQAAT